MLYNMHSKGKTDSLTPVWHKVQRKGPKYSSGFAGWSSKPRGKFQLQLLLFPAVEGETLPWAPLKITQRTITKAEQLGKSYCPRTHTMDPTVPWIKETNRGQTKRRVSHHNFTNNQAFCLNRENVALTCLFVVLHHHFD